MLDVCPPSPVLPPRRPHNVPGSPHTTLEREPSALQRALSRLPSLSIPKPALKLSRAKSTPQSTGPQQVPVVIDVSKCPEKDVDRLWNRIKNPESSPEYHALLLRTHEFLRLHAEALEQRASC